MMVLGSIVDRNNIWLIIIAALLCLAGSRLTARLFRRAASASGLLHAGAQLLTALAASIVIWCTHFVAVLGFDAGVSVGLDPLLTIILLLIVCIGGAAGFVFAGSRFAGFIPAIGGAIVAAPYTGTTAYRAQGIVSWESSYLISLIILSVGFATAALHSAIRRNALAGAVRDGKFIAGVSGDELSAIHRTVDPDDLSDFLNRLERALFKPVRIEDCKVVPGASPGIAIHPDDAANRASPINHADLATYRAKTGATQTACAFESSMDETVKARRHLAADLCDALARNQLGLHYQVQTSISTGKILGYEALLRWQHPQYGPIPPAEFISIAEESGLILQMGEWALRTACTAATSWEQPYRVALNLSAVQLTHADLARLVLQVLVETGLSPDRLELELTESTILADKDQSLNMLRRIKALGVRIALDDFGTGYSSLNTLRSLPFDRINLDRSLITEAWRNPQTIAIVRAVLAFGKSLNITVLAEGIETQEQLSMLNTEGCDEAQGFLLGRPVALNQTVDVGQVTLNENGQRQRPARGVASEVTAAPFDQSISPCAEGHASRASTTDQPVGRPINGRSGR